MRLHSVLFKNNELCASLRGRKDVFELTRAQLNLHNVHSAFHREQMDLPTPQTQINHQSREPALFSVVCCNLFTENFPKYFTFYL